MKSRSSTQTKEETKKENCSLLYPSHSSQFPAFRPLESFSFSSIDKNHPILSNSTLITTAIPSTTTMTSTLSNATTIPTTDTDTSNNTTTAAFRFNPSHATLLNPSWMFTPVFIDQISTHFSSDSWKWESTLIDAHTLQPVVSQDIQLNTRTCSQIELELYQSIEAVLQQDKRGYIVMNLYETERNYVKDLDLLITQYKLPIQSGKILAESSSRLLFSKIDELLNLHTIFCTKLEETIHPDRWSTESSRIGKVFVDYTSEFTVLYQKFIETYAISRKQLNAEIKTNPEFNLFLDKKFKSVKRELSEFLVLPVQRTTRYHLLLKDLVKQTEDTHPDFLDLVTSWEAMTKLAERINTAKRNADESMGLFEAYEQTKNCPPTLINASRRMVYQCTVTASNPLRKLHLFLCSDILLVTLPVEVGIFKKKEEIKKYKFYKIHDLTDLSIEDIDDFSILINTEPRNTSPRKNLSELSLDDHPITDSPILDVIPSPKQPSSPLTTHSYIQPHSPKISPNRDFLSHLKREQSSTTSMRKDIENFFAASGHIKQKDHAIPGLKLNEDAVKSGYSIRFEGYDPKKAKLAFIQSFDNELKKHLE